MSNSKPHSEPLGSAAADSRSRRRGRDGREIAFWAGLIGVTVAIVAIGAADAESWSVIYCGLLAVAVYLLFRRVRRQQPLSGHPLFWVAVAFGALVLTQVTLGTTVYAGATWTGMAELSGPAAILALSLFAFRRSSDLDALATWAWWMALLLGIEAIMQYYAANGYIYWVRDATYATPTGPFVYHNHFAGCMDLILPLAVAGVALPGVGRLMSKPQFCLRALAPALAFGAVVVSRSRGGLLALGFEALCAVPLFWRSLLRWTWKAWLATAGVVASLAIAANLQPVLHRFSLLWAGDVSAADRLRFAQSCIAIWRAFPWLGSGFNTFASIYPQFQTFDSGLTVLYAHNEYAQLLAEMGLAGAALVIAFVAVLAFSAAAARHARGHASLVHRAAIIGLAGFLFHSALDFQFHAPANALLFFFLAGAVAARPLPESAPPSHRRRRSHAFPQGGSTERSSFTLGAAPGRSV